VGGKVVFGVIVFGGFGEYGGWFVWMSLEEGLVWGCWGLQAVVYEGKFGGRRLKGA